MKASRNARTIGRSVRGVAGAVIVAFLLVLTFGVLVPRFPFETSSVTTSCPARFNAEGLRGDCKAIEALDHGFFTNITSVISLPEYAGENNNLGDLFVRSSFSLQDNSNYYQHNESWFQATLSIAPLGGDAGNGTLVAYPGLVLWWFGASPPSACPAGGWTNWMGPGGGWFCATSAPEIQIGDDYQFMKNSSLSLTVGFEVGAATYALHLIVNGVVVQTSGAQYQFPAQMAPDGRITSFESVVVGFGSDSESVFNQGNMISVVNEPMTNNGTIYGIDWAGNAPSIGSGESSNLIPSSIQYSNNEQVLDLVTQGQDSTTTWATN